MPVQNNFTSNKEINITLIVLCIAKTVGGQNKNPDEWLFEVDKTSLNGYNIDFKNDMDNITNLFFRNYS
ncbi:hypothetical protein [Wocania ichthyoenteri]|uniref:hypothetical protein n=1 Tax=Wocania ichthyoenteri TaxID=1230531 RepID=UPI00053D3FCB|nr:hypothetical protein [Wocania ichthyoenteri]